MSSRLRLLPLRAGLPSSAPEDTRRPSASSLLLLLLQIASFRPIVHSAATPSTIDRYRLLVRRRPEGLELLAALLLESPVLSLSAPGPAADAMISRLGCCRRDICTVKACWSSQLERNARKIERTKNLFYTFRIECWFGGMHLKSPYVVVPFCTLKCGSSVPAVSMKSMRKDRSCISGTSAQACGSPPL